MSDVKQTIQVTNAGLSPILSIAQGTGMVEFEFTVSDFLIPAGSTAVAWNIQPTGNIVSQVCTLVGNVIIVTPPAYYFLRGKNYMQIQVTGADGVNLFTFLIEVWCAPNISAPVVSHNPDLITQLMAMIGNMQDLDTTAKNNLVAAINEIYARGVVDILDTEEEIEANTDAGKATGALVTKQLISELKFPDGTKFYPDMQDGEYGFNTAADRGADTFHPFSSFNLQDYELITYWATPRGTSQGNISDYPYTVSDDRDILVLTIFSTYAGSGIKCLLNGNAPENSIVITIPGQISIYLAGSSAATFNNAYIGLSYIKAKTGDRISLESFPLTYTGITAIMGKK